MKRKIFLILCTLIACISLCFSLAACNGGTQTPSPHTHVFGEYVYNNDATCTEDGTETATCTICQTETDTRTAQGTAGHKFTAENKCSVCGAEWEYTEGLEFEENSDGYSVTGIGTASGDIVIPYGYNKKFVTMIGDYAFGGCTSLTSVTIGDGVTSIGESAFEGCTSLTSVAIGGSVTLIGYRAFVGCTSLTSVVIPDSVTLIGYEAFYYCTSLTSVTIPDSVTVIEPEAFYKCTSLTSVTIGDGVTSIGGYAFRDCNSLMSVTIGDGVTSIGYEAFFDTGYYNDAANWTGDVLYIGKYLIKAKDTISGAYSIQEGTRVIAEDAFYECGSLTNVMIPDSVISIGAEAFEDTGYYNDESNWTGDALYIGQYLIQVKDTISNAYSIQQGTKVIAGEAFRYCESLTSVTIPESVSSIGDWVFYGCTSLTSVTIPDSVTSIGESAFEWCTSLTSVTIPDSVTKIGDRAFEDCKSLTGVTIPDSVTSIGVYAFCGCNSLTSVTIPDSVTSIGGTAFSGCTSLTSVTIGGGVTEIGNWAFSGCTSLTSIEFQGTVAQWQKIQKGTNWNNSTDNYTITCTDGKIDNNGKVTMFDA